MPTRSLLTHTELTRLRLGLGVQAVFTLVLLAGFDARLIVPFAVWIVAYGLACWYFVPRLGKVGKAQADARSILTGIAANQSLVHTHHFRAFFVNRDGIEIIDFNVRIRSYRMRHRASIFRELHLPQHFDVINTFNRTR